MTFVEGKPKEGTAPEPGDIGLTKIGGVLGWFVYLAQWFNGDKSQWTHAFVVLPHDQVIEAAPGGAEIFHDCKYLDRDTVYVSPEGLSEEQRRLIVAEAVRLHGTPYSFADYLALFLGRVKLCRGITRNYVRNSGHMICSQFVDEAYRRSGVHLFDDGRLSQDVTPGDLARRFNAG